MITDEQAKNISERWSYDTKRTDGKSGVSIQEKIDYCEWCSFSITDGHIEKEKIRAQIEQLKKQL